MFTLPTHDGWVVQVRDSSKPKGKQAIERDLYTQDKLEAMLRYTDMTAKYKNSATVKIVITQAIF